eukprot:CAMPEP_0185185500 /NCGR_PEP_ID=MMETSP1140-20130426/3347_1 /TAXON_ID=298111 /ORGANISM="Pavlova sp., Strain CCMP459" /LENGTH=372 /DNA_ID=CAMNT_0027751695 /DNA_START=33 /DNA_END=1151 /DNA_ORIENTATION=-
MSPSPRKTRVVHLIGSAVSTYYELLSTQYAQACIANAKDAATLAEFDFKYALVQPTEKGPRWSFPNDLENSTIAAARRVEHGEALSIIAAMEADVCVPHMFCYPGMTAYRAIFDVLGIPFVGCPVECMSLTTDKFQSRAVVAAAGVRVAKGELLRRGDKPSIPVPFVLKPCCEDNSMGVSIVRDISEVTPALEEAFKFDDQVVCEAYIPLGREIRCAVLENDKGEPDRILPCLEYFLSDDHPIRVSTDKVAVDAQGQPTGLASGGRKCPADVDDVLLAKLSDATIRSHRALGCRDFSLYDFRIDPQGEVYFLEACPVCSFSQKSVIVSMASASGDDDIAHPRLFHTMLRRAAARGSSANGSTQAFGMRANGY